MHLNVKRDQILPALIGIASAIIFLAFTLNLPGMKFIGIDWRLAILAALAFLSFKIYRWSQGLFSETPP